MIGQVAQNVEGKGQDQEKTAGKAKGKDGDQSQSQDRLALGVMTLNDFSLWSELSLKTFLSLRKKPSEGPFEELASRAFVAYEENAPVDLEQEELEKRNLEEYKKKLVINGTVLPDPLGLRKGWVGEKDGIQKWPSLYVTDISKYFNNVIDSADLIHRLECEYKEGKAYRYFTDEFIKEISIHSISTMSDYCILKTKCTPSQRISARAYDVWAILRKDEEDSPGGEVMSAFCSCTAGLLGSCNHVAGMLFRVEAAVITGVTKPTCTSRKSEWVIPQTKTSTEPGRISNFLIRKDHYKKKAISKSKKEQLENASKKLKFSPMSDTQLSYLQQPNKVRNDLYTQLKGLVPGSCFEEFMEGQRLCQKSTVQTNTKPTLQSNTKPSVIDIAKDLRQNTELELIEPSEAVDRLLAELKFKPEDITTLYQKTVGQSENAEWINQRKGRLTASKFKSIYTRATTLQNNPNEDPSNLISTVLGYKTFRPTWQMKHGIATEVHAKTKYLSLMKSERHTNLTYIDPGMTVMEEYPFISVSTDLDISCDCCGKGHAEFKCPGSIKDQVPSDKNLSYLELRNGETKLKKNSDYYFQIQGQMGVAEGNYTDFFVFTFHGYHKERILFDKEFWCEVLQKLVWFWKKFIGPELVTCNLKHQLEEDDLAQALQEAQQPSSSKHATTSESSETTCNSMVILISEQVVADGYQKTCIKKKKEKTKPEKKKRSVKTSVCLCGTCQKEVVDGPTKFEEESVGCDKCPLWYHFICAGITEDSRPKPRDSWICPTCS